MGHILSLVLFSFGLKAFFPFIFGVVDVVRNRIAIEDNRIARCQKFLKFFFIFRIWIQPEVEITGIFNDCRHSVMKIFYRVIGVCGDDGEGFDGLILALLVFSFPVLVLII